MINTSDFLKGYFYSIFVLYNHPAFGNEFSFQMKVDSNQLPLFTKEGGKLIVAINRGICPTGGNVPYAHTRLKESLFDIVNFWTTDVTWKLICFIHDVDCEEVRIDFKALVYLIENLGGLDIEAMNDYIVKFSKNVDN